MVLAIHQCHQWDTRVHQDCVGLDGHNGGEFVCGGFSILLTEGDNGFVYAGFVFNVGIGLGVPIQAYISVSETVAPIVGNIANGPYT